MRLCAIPLSAADDTVVVCATRRLINVLDAFARCPCMSLLAHNMAGRRPIRVGSSTAAVQRRRIPPKPLAQRDDILTELVLRQSFTASWDIGQGT
jgi:hypothetical protein